jgi:multidrug resistance efflux pump
MSKLDEKVGAVLVQGGGIAGVQAALDLARRRLTDAGLYAPADGVIRNRILEPGDMASPQRPAYPLALNDPVWVRAYVSEPDLGKIRSGLAARVTTDSYPDKGYAGWVGYISPTAEFTPKAVGLPFIVSAGPSRVTRGGWTWSVPHGGNARYRARRVFAASSAAGRASASE